MQDTASDLLAKLTNDTIAQMGTEDLKEAFVVLHTSYQDAGIEVEDLKDERNAVAAELAARDVEVVQGYRIVLQTRVGIEDGYEDSDSPEIAELDREIAALKRRRDALVRNQRDRAAKEGRTVESVSVLVREVA